MRSALFFCLSLLPCCSHPTGVLAPGDGFDPGHPPDVPPPMPPGAHPGDGPGATFVVRKLRLGTQAVDGSFDMNAWASVGLDLDGRDDSSAPFKGHCKPNLNANPAAVFHDGELGIDNGFFSTVAETILLPLGMDFEDESNARITSGEWSLALRVADLGDANVYTSLTINAYELGPTSQAPTWSGDVWPVRDASVEGADLAAPKATFTSGYLADDVLVGLPPGSVTISFSWSDYPITLVLHHATLVVTLAPDHQSGTGVLAGVLAREEAVEAIHDAAAHITTDLCAGTTIDSILDRVREASDILVDGEQSALQTCDGISIGIGVEVVRAELGDVLPPVDPIPLDCF